MTYCHSIDVILVIGLLTAVFLLGFCGIDGGRDG